MSSIEIQPARAPVVASIRPPGSKSLTNRALACAALARGTSTLLGVLASEDTAVMIDALAQLGIAIRVDDARHVAKVTGCGGRIPATAADLYVANSGTTVRFLTALVSLGHGTFRLHGTPRMHQRPIEDLLAALAALGVRAESEAGNGCPPVVVHAAGLAAANTTIRGDVSSQFLSGLLMAAPCAAADDASQALEIDVVGPLVSKPYVAMTLAVMRAFGAKIDHDPNWQRFTVARSGYQAKTFEIEPDASAASYFWAAAAITGGKVTVEGLGKASLQGDVAFCDCLEKMGCTVRDEPAGLTVEGGTLVGIDVDMNATSDTVQTLAAVALFARGPTNIRNVAHIRHKETDRIAALAIELEKLGATVEERADGLRIVPGPLRGAQIDTYDDHRMAMSLALVGLKLPGVVINDPECTAKTYPDFWKDLERLQGS
jgi:3-phosphoshikimate 1-carboxyvinyltransferase